MAKIKLPRVPKMRRFRHGTRKGGIEGVEVDSTPTMFAALPLISAEAVTASGRSMVEEMLRLFRTDGDGRWVPNTQLTRTLKGHAKVMRGRTRTAISVLQGGEPGRMFVGSVSPTVRGASAQFGWPEDPHPDTDGTFAGFVGGEWNIKQASPGRGLTIADIMTLHEFGYTAQVPVMGAKGKTKMKKVQVPPRPWLTLAADNLGERINFAMLSAVHGGMDLIQRAHNAAAISGTIAGKRVPLMKSIKHGSRGRR